jgi:hypothetical protein
VISDNPNYDPAWTYIIRSADDDAHLSHYILEIHPTGIRRPQYGVYPLRLYCRAPGRYAESRCALIVKPCIRLAAKPCLKTWPAGEVSLSLENCGRTAIDVSVSIRHRGSNWSDGWEFELRAGDGPFEFSEKFNPPAGARGGNFELDISAAGISIVRMRMQAKRLSIPRKHIATAAVLLVGAAIGTPFAVAGTSTALAPQAISFTSIPPTGPAIGNTYDVTASGGASGNPVTFTIDSSSTSICSISGSTVTFNGPGSCIIDANQAGNARYQPAPQAHQEITINPIQ